jgi:CheY-like chemotaxis protein
MPIRTPQAHLAVVDHDDAVRAMFVEALTAEGYRVTPLCGDGCTYAVLADLRPDLIIHDYTPTTAEPDLAALRQLTGAPPTRSIPLVLCSAVPEAELEAVAAALGTAPVQVIPKPFDLTALLHRIAAALGDPNPGEPRPHLHTDSSCTA